MFIEKSEMEDLLIKSNIELIQEIKRFDYMTQRYKMALEAIRALPSDGFYIGAKNIASIALEEHNG